MLLHAAHAVACGYKRMMLRTVDTDVLVLAVFTVQMLSDRECQPFEHWASFGSGRNHRNISAHMIASSLGLHKARSLPAFLAFTRCDTAIWRCFPEATESFLALKSHPSDINRNLMSNLQRFVVLLCDRGSTRASVNEARKQLFVQKGRQFYNIPPPEADLKEYVKRTAYQADHVWGKALVPSPELPSPQDWGWILEDGMWKQYWTSQPEIVKSCQELISCGCKKKCTERCSCTKHDIRCTNLCRYPDVCDKR